MEILRVTQLSEDLWVLDEIGKTNMFVLRGREKALLIDTGFGLSDLPAVMAGLCGDLPQVVVNTHAHIDHNSGNNQFDKVMVGRFDEPGSLEPVSEIHKLRCIENYLGPLLTEGYDLSLWKPGPTKRIEPIADGDSIDLGGLRLEVLETPGHTCGSICLWERERGWLFSGDLMLTWEVWGQLTRSTFGSSCCLRYYAQSLERLAALPGVRDVWSAHGKDHDNPPGCTHYRLPPEVCGIYAQGTRAIVDGKIQGRPYTSLGGSGLCADFAIGGMVYRPDRI